MYKIGREKIAAVYRKGVLVKILRMILLKSKDGIGR